MERIVIMKKITKPDPFQTFDELDKLVEDNGWNMATVGKNASPPVTRAAITSIRKRIVKNPKWETIHRLIESYEKMIEERKEKTGR